MRDDDGQSPLDRVLEDVDYEDNLDLGLYLINHGCGGDEGKVKLMCVACFWSKLDVVKELVELHKVDPNGECIYYSNNASHCHTPSVLCRCEGQHRWCTYIATKVLCSVDRTTKCTVKYSLIHSLTSDSILLVECTY